MNGINRQRLGWLTLLLCGLLTTPASATPAPTIAFLPLTGQPAPSRISAGSIHSEFTRNPGTYNGFVTTTFIVRSTITGSVQDPLTRARLIISGTPAGQSGTQSTQLFDISLGVLMGTTFKDVWIDSTHFQNGTPMSVELDVWDSSSPPIMASGFASSRPKNRAYVLANVTVGYGDQELAAASVLGSVGYSLIANESDTKPQILARLPANTVFFIDSHGNFDNFGDCVYQQSDNYVIANQVGWTEVAAAIAKKNASEPPYNFAMLNCCETAGTTGQTPQTLLADAFGVNNPGQDQAYLGWHFEMMQMRENADWTNRFWQSVKKGDTVQVAAVRASLDGYPQGEVQRGVPDVLADVMPIIQGDSATKLHGVYSGHGTDWYKVP